MSETNGQYEPSDGFGLVRSYTRHLAFVRESLTRVMHALELRALRHDASKMLDDEFAGFCRINAAARINKFGSPEYAEAMQRERETIDLHFSRNSHHPERPTLLATAHPLAHDDFQYETERVRHSMTFLDVIEMVCDWRGAQLGYGDTRTWREGFDLNMQHKGKYLSTEEAWLAHQVADFIEKGDTHADGFR